MTLLMRTAGVTVLSLSVVACGGGGPGGDAGAIEDVFRDFFQAFENEDAEALASLLNDSCEDAESRANEAIDALRDRVSGVIEFEISGVDVRDLTDRTAEAVARGFRRFNGERIALGADGEDYASLEKVDGAWKFADCDFLFGS